MNMLSDKERRQAVTALMEWFKSQGLDPGEASLVMLELMSILLVDKTTSIPSLQEAINSYKAVLSMNVALELKVKGIA